VTNSKIALPTSRAIESRSIAWAGEAKGGHANSRGDDRPQLRQQERDRDQTRRLTCSPWVIA
jgi:hypothetical protein